MPRKEMKPDPDRAGQTAVQSSPAAGFVGVSRLLAPQMYVPINQVELKLARY